MSVRDNVHSIAGYPIRLSSVDPQHSRHESSTQYCGPVGITLTPTHFVHFPASTESSLADPQDDLDLVQFGICVQLPYARWTSSEESTIIELRRLQHNLHRIAEGRLRSLRFRGDSGRLWISAIQRRNDVVVRISVHAPFRSWMRNDLVEWKKSFTDLVDYEPHPATLVTMLRTDHEHLLSAASSIDSTLQDLPRGHKH